jgi:hypothetical protein
MYGSETFQADASRELAFLVERGFRTVESSPHLVRWESETLGAEAILDRGQVDVAVFRLGHEQPWERWTCTGAIGRASVSRLLQIAAERLLQEEAVLRGDRAFFEHLAARQKRESEEWTAYYEGSGPRPQTGKLP